LQGRELLLRGTTLVRPRRPKDDSRPVITLLRRCRDKGYYYFTLAAPRRVRLCPVPACSDRRLSGTGGKAYYSSSTPLLLCST